MEKEKSTFIKSNFWIDKNKSTEKKYKRISRLLTHSALKTKKTKKNNESERQKKLEYQL